MQRAADVGAFDPGPAGDLCGLRTGMVRGPRGQRAIKSTDVFFQNHGGRHL